MTDLDFSHFGLIAEMVQLLLVAWVELMLHQPREHCGHARFGIGQELVPFTGKN